MIYAIDQSDGRLFTEEEYWEEYKYSLPDRGVNKAAWDSLPHLDIPDDLIEDARKKYAYIYAPPLEKGQLLLSHTDRGMYLVTNVIDGVVFVKKTHPTISSINILDFPYSLIAPSVYISTADQQAIDEMYKKNNSQLMWGK